MIYETIDNILGEYDDSLVLTLDDMLMSSLGYAMYYDSTMVLEMIYSYVLRSDTRRLKLLCTTCMVSNSINRLYNGNNILVHILSQYVDQKVKIDINPVLDILCGIDELTICGYDVDKFKYMYYNGCIVGNVGALKKLLKNNMRHASIKMKHEIDSLRSIIFHSNYQSYNDQSVINDGMNNIPHTLNDLKMHILLMCNPIQSLGCTILDKDIDHATSLNISSMMGHTDAMEWLYGLNVFNMREYYKGFRSYDLMALNGNLDAAIRFIKSNAPITFGEKFICLCIHNNYIDILKYMTSYIGPHGLLKFDQCNILSLLSYAILINNIEVVDLLLQYDDGYEPSGDTSTLTLDLLYMAVYTGNLTIIKILCDKGYDARNGLYFTFMCHRSVTNDVMNEMIDYFLTFDNHDTMIKWSNGYNLLMLASKTDNLKIINYIYDHGLEVDVDGESESLH